MNPSEINMLVIGHLTVDDIVLPSGETAMETPGGDALYASLGACLWGAKPQLVAARPHEYPAQILEAIQKQGIDTGFLQLVDVPGVRQWALYDKRGGRQYHPQLGSSTYVEISPRIERHVEPQKPPGAAHIAPMPLRFQYEWVRWLSDGGCPWISIDPHEDELRDAKAWKDILSYATAFLPSEVEVAALLGAGVDWFDAAREVSQWGPRIVVIKRGPLGSLLYDRTRDQFTQLPAVGAAVVDPTGCGDAFCGGFMVGACVVGNPALAAEWGAVSSAFVLQGYGPHGAMNISRDQAVGRWRRYQEEQLMKEGWV